MRMLADSILPSSATDAAQVVGPSPIFVHALDEPGRISARKSKFSLCSYMKVELTVVRCFRNSINMWKNLACHWRM